MGWAYDSTHSVIEFGSRHLGLALIKGRFHEANVEVTLDDADALGATIRATINAASIDTDLSRRDDRLRGKEYLDVEQFPTFTFVSKRVEPYEGKHRVVGDLSIKGQIREVVLDTMFCGEVTDGRGVTRRGFSASTRVARADFGIQGEALPGGSIIGLSDDIYINLEVELTRQD